MRKDLFLYWGKVGPCGSLYHPAVCHMIDVGIVARELFEAQPPPLRSRLLSSFGQNNPDNISFLAALHDIGKISPGFQIKREDLCGPLKKIGLHFPAHAESDHGKVASSSLYDIFIEEFGCNDEAALVLSQAVAAHHGIFLSEGKDGGGRKWDEARKAAVKFLADVFGVKSLRDLPVPSSADIFIFAGLLTLADWLGSSEEHFPYSGSNPIDVPSYISDRRGRARAFIKELGFGQAETSDKSFTELFPFLPNPSQEAVLKAAARLSHPMLLVVESPMGSGKTEAAQAVYSLLASRDALKGMYYALPTQATGNAMFPRMRSFLERLGLPGPVEFHLIHANKDLNKDYEALRINDISDKEGRVTASAWFTARKRGILAGFGTGTIDQALMAVLKVRHFFLRLYGLAGKLLVLDEVHAYDSYMEEEISRLIGWLSQCGTSVVLLSATLPSLRRKKLLEAFSPEIDVPAEIRYPCVIGVDGSGRLEYEEIKGLDESQVTFPPVVSTPEDKAAHIAGLLRDKLADGGSAACVLNTVSEAQAVYESVKKEVPGCGIILFHSRFKLEERLEIEEKILSFYGKDGKRPSKGIVIATQVIEQSLDVDFDFMVSDLAPIDLLLQRAGRLHRHKNNRPPLLRERSLHVLMPDVLSVDPDFGLSGYVYFKDILSRTALLFTNNGAYGPLVVELPYGVSTVIETVYGDESGLTSERLQAWVEERIGTDMAKAFAAKQASLKNVRECLDDPFYIGRLSNDNEDEMVISTRLSRPNVTLLLMEEGESLSVNSREEARRLYGRTIVTDNIHLVRHFRPLKPPPEWKEVPLLRHCRPLFLKNGRGEFGGRIVTYDDSGLRIIKSLKEVK